MKCQSKNNNGSPCNANAMNGLEYCCFHNPTISAEEKKQIQRRGGQNRVTTISTPLPPIKMEKISDVVSLLAEVINEVRTGRMDTKVANCLGVLSGSLIKAMEISALEGRIEILERRITINNRI